MEAQKTYDHRSLNTPSNGYTNTSNRSSFAYSFTLKHTPLHDKYFTCKSRETFKSNSCSSSSNLKHHPCKQASFFFSFLWTGMKQSHTTLKWDPHQHDDDQMCKHGPSALLFCISPKEQSFIGEWLWWELHSFMSSSPQKPNCPKRKRNV